MTQTTAQGHIMVDFLAHMEKLSLSDGDVLVVRFEKGSVSDTSASRIGEAVQQELQKHGIGASVLVCDGEKRVEKMSRSQLERVGLVDKNEVPPELALAERLLLQSATEFAFQGDEFAVSVTLNNHPDGEGYALYHEESATAEREVRKLWLMETQEGPTGSHAWLAEEPEDDSAWIRTFEILEPAVRLALDYANGKKTSPGQWNHTD
jgi:hypothetical protein